MIQCCEAALRIRLRSGRALKPACGLPGSPHVGREAHRTADREVGAPWMPALPRCWRRVL